MCEKSVKHVSDIVGEWGPWQRNITLFALSISVFSAFNNLAVSFYAPNIEYWCADNSTDKQLDNLHSILQNNSLDGCKYGCKEWRYDKDRFTLTIIDEWGLVCDRNRLASLSQSLYMIGYVIGAIVFGHFSDRYGRLPMIWISTIIEILGGLSSAASVSILHFTISRIILAFGSNGRLLSTFMLINECIGPKYRANVGMYVQCGWALGYCILPAIAYLLTDFRLIILATTLPEILWLFWLWTIPESPRWQIIHGKIDKAEQEMMRAVQRNYLAINDVNQNLELLRENVEREEEKLKIERKSTVLDLLKTPNLRQYTLILYFTWFVNSFVYYGISLNIGDYGGNLFLNFFIAGIIEFPSYLFCVFVFPYLGRRPLTALLMYGSGVACFATIPFVDTSHVTLRITVAMIGKFCITSSYGLIYVYSSEIYPTILRQSGVGSCSIAARVGSVIAPFVKDLNYYTGMGVVLSIYGSLSIVNGFSIHFLPETRGSQVVDTLEEAENMNKNKIDLEEKEAVYTPD